MYGLYGFPKLRARFVGRFVDGLYTVCRKVLHDKRFSGLATNRTNRHTNRHTNRARRLGNSYKPYKPYTKGAYFPTPQIVTVCTVCMNSLSAVHGLYDGLYTVCTVCMMVGMCASRPVREGFRGVHILLGIHAAERVEQATAVFCCPPLGGEGQNRFVLDMTLNCRLPHPVVSLII